MRGQTGCNRIDRTGQLGAAANCWSCQVFSVIKCPLCSVVRCTQFSGTYLVGQRGQLSAEYKCPLSANLHYILKCSLGQLSIKYTCNFNFTNESILIINYFPQIIFRSTICHFCVYERHWLPHIMILNYEPAFHNTATITCG